MTQQNGAKDVEAEIDCLADLSLDELKARFLELKGVPLPKFMRHGLMTQAVAHAIREAAHGGLDRETQKLLDQLVRQIVPAGAKPPPAPNRIKAGTKLLREWKGTVHEVLVTKDGFAWQGATHPSLSTIARQITGTRWNGWVFFGLKKLSSEKCGGGSKRLCSTGHDRAARTSRAIPREAAHG